MICKIWNVISIMLNLLQASLSKYDDLMSDGYDHKFSVYSQEMVYQAGDALANRCTSHGPDYFDCTVTEKATCCSGCARLHPQSQCLYCEYGDACVPDGPFSSEEKFAYENKSEPCPPDFSKRGIGGNGYQSVYWNLRQGDAAKFYSDVGIPQEYVGFRPYRFHGPDATDEACLSDPLSAHCRNEDWYLNFPYPMDNYTPDNVTNPKLLISNAMSKWRDAETGLSNASSGRWEAGSRSVTAWIRCSWHTPASSPR